MAKPEWITLDPMSGSGDGSIQVTASSYTGRSDREGIITAATSSAQDTSQVVQHGKAEFITADETPLSVGNEGGTVVISGTSNSANIKVAEGSDKIDGVTYKIEINEVEDDSWNGNSDTGIDGDPGASAEFVFKITATFPANQGGSSRTHKVTLQNGDASVSSQEITITQSSGTMTYADPVIETISYATDVPADGGSVTPEVTYSQTWGWNGATTGGGTITSGGTLVFTGDNVDPGTGEVTGENLGTTVKGRTKLATASVIVTLNGKTSAAKTADAYQEANSATYGEVTINGGTVDDIPASGGTVSSASGVTTSQTVSFTSGETRAGSVDTSYSQGVTGDNLGTEVTSRTQKGTLVLTATGEGGKQETKSFDVYQEANIATYGEVRIMQDTPVTLAAEGQTFTFTTGPTQVVMYSSGERRTQVSSDNPVVIENSYEVKTPQEGFLLRNNTVIVPANPGTSQRGGFVVTITSTGEGGKSATKDITFNQQGSESAIEVSPEELTFEASGGTQTFTITSNDSWTIS